jgi:hypothetical protein
MVRRGIFLFVPIFVALMIAMPAVAAADTGAKSANTTRVTIDLLHAVALGGKQLKPGTYQVNADDMTVKIEQHGKVVAEAPVQWKDETKKPEYSHILSVGDQVTEMHFAGKMRYVVIAG